MESTVFKCGRGQGVYLPEAVALPDEVTHVEIVVALLPKSMQLEWN